MRIAVKGTIAFLGLYILVLAGAAVWAEIHLRAVASTLAAGTARLVGNEIARTVRESATEELLTPDQATRDRLAKIVDDVTEHSNVVVSLSVVDASGRVVASDSLDAGTQLAIPQAIFSSVQQGASASKLSFHGGDYHLFVPLVRNQEIVGYLRLLLKSQRIERLYHRAERQFLYAGASGLIGVALLGVLLHVQLSRRARTLARALEKALHGQGGIAGAGSDEFTEALQVAREFGQELTAAREEHAQASRRLSALLDAQQGGVIVVGADGNLEIASPLACELFGVNDIGELRQQWPRLRTLLSGCLEKDGAGVSHDVELPSATGGRCLRVESSALDGASGGERMLLVKNRDTVEALERELGLAIQMRGLARFYAAFAHDLRAPLNAMVMNLELLRQTLSDEPDEEDETHARQLRYTRVLQEELSRLNRQLSLLLRNTVPEEGHTEQVDLSDLIADVAGLLAPQARRQGVTLSTRLPEHKVTLTGNRDRLKQALLNVAINALEAMPKGGELFFGLHVAEGESRAEVELSDTGPGIPPEVLQDIYDMHFTTKEGGTGVGLYVARAAVHSCGGTISVESREGKGTTFRLTLPVGNP